MASDSHLELSGFIKSVHQNLRVLSKEIGPEKAWEVHCKQENTLKKYAGAMKDLAILHWDINNENSSSKCRIEWVLERCILYFHNGDRENEFKKEIDLLKKHSLLAVDNIEEAFKKIDSDSRLKLLDVGSCYNAFKKFPVFDVTAVDLCPSEESVYKCDFLKCSIGNENVCPSTDGVIETFLTSSYDVIVFSLLLEYLPDSRQRFKCCENAYKILQPGGALFILTPDSKHETANSKLMKRWRVCLASLGFTRVYYNKLRHLHCMMFKKAVHSELPKRWYRMKKFNDTEPEDMLTIPQDVSVLEKDNNREEVSSFDCKSSPDLFLVLPMDG